MWWKHRRISDKGVSGILAKKVAARGPNINSRFSAFIVIVQAMVTSATLSHQDDLPGCVSQVFNWDVR